MGPARGDQEVVAGWNAGISGSVVRAGRVVHVEHVWGTAVTINLAGTALRERDALAGIDDCRAFFEQVDLTFSTFMPHTEVARYRAMPTDRGPQSPEFDEVMRACRELRVATQGAFDPWAVPGGYDPSGYVKGWAAGRASDLLRGAGFADHLVNAGGDIWAGGDEDPGSGRGWPTGIVNPHAPNEVIEVVALSNQAMATSGRYERGDHVIDPQTGHSARGVDSATVVGPDAGIADAAASAALVHGEASMTWFADLGPSWSLHLVMGQSVRTVGPAFDSPSAVRR